MSNEVMIVAGEASGDLHGSHLVQAMQARNPDLHFCGIGGRELRACGVELLFDASKIAVVGFFEVITHLGDIINAQKTLRRRLVETRPDLLILIDFPDFNLLLARKAKKLGIPIFYYISPQVWAWRSGRVKTIRRLVDVIGVILPFEEPFYRRRGVTAHYVGHPLLDSVQTRLPRDKFCELYRIDAHKKLIGIIPGSRIKEIRNMLPVFLAGAERFQQRCEEAPVFLVPRASTIEESDLLEHGINDYSSRLDIRIISQDHYSLMAACDAAVVTSGTVTLEVMLVDTPMVVAYKFTPMTYLVGKLLIHNISYFSLVNLIAEKEVIPELLQDEANSERVAEELYRLVFDEQARKTIARGFETVRTELGEPGASKRAAELALSLLHPN